MNKTITRQRSPEQAAYLQARSADTDMSALIASTMGECPDEMSDATIVAYVEQEVALRRLFGAQAVEDHLTQAEEALLAWGHMTVKSGPRYAANRNELEALFAGIATHAAQRGKLIELIMRLA